MSEIPIGSPPAPPGRHAAPQGWYPDPVGPSRERYWDGWSWTQNTRETAAPPSGPGYQGQQPYAGGPGPGSGAPEAPRTADGVQLAGWWWRFLAGILDLILVGIVSSLAAFPLYLKTVPVITDYFAEGMAAAERGETIPPLQPTDLMSTTDQAWIALISAVVGLLYFALFWRFKSATPAQLLCGLRVRPFGQGANTDRLDWSPVLIRAALWSIPFTVGSLLLIFGLLNGLSPLWNQNKQAIHDLAAKTQLVKIK